MPLSIVAALSGIGIALAIYTATIFSILHVPWIETHAVYMHKLRLIGRKDLRYPEQFGFAHRQVSSFFLETKDGVSLHAWHVLPVGVYHKNATRLVRQCLDAKSQDTLNFNLLKSDPEARLVIHTHGSSGALAAYCRSETYRALSSLAPNKIHGLAFDYRGFGLSSGVPSGQGLRVDAQAIFDWAHKTAGVPSERIVVFGQSMGSSVAIALTRDLALQKISVAGLIITGAFPDVPTMLGKYRTIFSLRPFGLLARFPGLIAFCTRRMRNKWANIDALMDLVRNCSRYHVQILHAQDDRIVPWTFSNSFFEDAVRAAGHSQLGDEEFEEEKKRRTNQMGEGGWSVEWPTSRGLIRQEVPRYGEHDKIMLHPSIALAVIRAFQSRESNFQG
ncbi:hypothetical protein HBH70_142770 [Parastagonospora nodorum]|nr:hypothetical protein HBH70_142770 [Parastagonospora nodorum]